MELLPSYIVLPIVFIFGVVIGSFLNVVIYRFHTGRSLNDRSHCLSCSHQLAWYELFPLFSYLMLRGRCLTCGAHIPPRYLLVEVLTGLGFVMVWLHTQDWVFFGLMLAIVCVLIVGSVYDLYHMIIPDEIVVATSVLACGAVGYEYYLTGVLDAALWSLAAGVLAFCFYGLLWLVSGGRWLGFGDAKLAFPLGILVGIEGIFSMIVLSFWIGAVVSLCILSLQTCCSTRAGTKNRRYFTIKSEIPFAPFLVGAFLLVQFYTLDVLSLTSYAIEFLSNSL